MLHNAHFNAPVKVCEGQVVLELSQFHAGLALGPQQTADVKVTAEEAVDSLRPGIPNVAQTSTYVPMSYVGEKSSVLRRSATPSGVHLTCG